MNENDRRRIDKKMSFLVTVWPKFSQIIRPLTARGDRQGDEEQAYQRTGEMF